MAMDTIPSAMSVASVLPRAALVASAVVAWLAASEPSKIAAIFSTTMRCASRRASNCGQNGSEARRGTRAPIVMALASPISNAATAALAMATGTVIRARFDMDRA
jgi:hypothetical protein